MAYEHYLDNFRKAADRIDKRMLQEKQLELNVGVKLNSVVLKLYKKEWANDKIDPLNANTRIFFSIWVNVEEETKKQNKVFYNIHAFKLRELEGYAIKSRDFAESFRKEFVNHKQNWMNISVEFGPLTLMQGWGYFDKENLDNSIVNLANNFVSIDYLIDNTLKKFKKRKTS